MNTDMNTDMKEILNIVDKYLDVTNTADISLAESIWAQDAKPTLIFPRGHAKNWEEILHFYGNLTKTFAKRTLVLTSKPVINMHGDMAIAEFYWNFKAVKHDGEMAETNGRETQVLYKRPEGWRIVHVHYSRMPEA